MNTQADNVSGSVLCIPCGMCCDGSLFRFAELRADEQTFAASLGVTLLKDKEKHGFQLPCHLFKNDCCSIYQQPRPKVCGKFECRLLQNYKNSKISIEEGLNKVRQARQMQTVMASLAPQKLDGNLTLDIINSQMSLLSSKNEPERREHLQFLMEATKYQMFLLSHFFIRRQKKTLPLADQPTMTA